MKRLAWILGMVLLTIGIIGTAPLSARGGCEDIECNGPNDCPMWEGCTVCITLKGVCYGE